ncbi:hypothetical protein KCU64_g16, partial [Aureobasidium melanogenum]
MLNVGSFMSFPDPLSIVLISLLIIRQGYSGLQYRSQFTGSNFTTNKPSYILQVRCVVGTRTRFLTAFCVVVLVFLRLGCLVVHLDWLGGTATSSLKQPSISLGIIRLVFRLTSSAAMSAWVYLLVRPLTLLVPLPTLSTTRHQQHLSMLALYLQAGPLPLMMEDLVPTVQSLNATVAPLDARLRVVIEWCEGYMAV